MRIREEHRALAGGTHAQQEIARTRQPRNMRAHLPVQRADVDTESATPVVDAVPIERVTALGEKPRDFRVRRLELQPLRDREALRHEIAPDVVVVSLIQQRAVEIEKNGIDARPVGFRPVWGR